MSHQRIGVALIGAGAMGTVHGGDRSRHRRVGDRRDRGSGARLRRPSGEPAPAGQYSLDPDSHHLQYMDVVGAIIAGTQPRVTVQHAFDARALIRSIYVSSTLGRPVQFSDVAAGRYDDVQLSVTGR